jgi:hypothetical protein
MITPFQSNELEKHSLVLLNDLSNTQRPHFSAPALFGARTIRHPHYSAPALFGTRTTRHPLYSAPALFGTRSTRQ